MKKKLFYVLVITLFGVMFLSCKDHLIGIALNNPTVQTQTDSWQLVRSSVNEGNYCDIFFADENNGWATLSSGKIIHTTDGGTNWEYQQTPLNKLVYSVYFIDKTKGWACGENKILSTTDGGKNWNIIFTDTLKSKFGLTDSSYKYYQQIAFVDEYIGFAVNESAELYRTTDGGYKWIKQKEWLNGGPASISVVNDKCFVLTPSNNLFISTNKGLSWQEKSMDGINYVSSIKFSDENNGWLITKISYNNTMEINSPVYITSDGGNTWQFSDSIPDLNLTSIDFTDKNNVWVSGIDGIYSFHNSKDGFQKSLTDRYFIDVFALDAKHVWALGFNGRIYKLVNK
ncbi:MAG: hypothetical protein C4539_07860 [Ignavibacteriales bacterium]|nr:MAG: hypothetical protein C4539_07860 [Ignavibacteriales bacterium]